MLEVADGVWQIPLAPRESVNAYLLGDVLVDAGTPGMGKKLPGRLSGRTVSAHAITHAHPDHVGGSKAVVEALGIPLWAPAGDADDAARGQAAEAPEGTRFKKVKDRNGRFPAVPVARRLAEGDEVGNGFVVVDAPGHSPGQVAYWRASDRVLVCGDVWFNISFKTLRAKLRPPFDFVTYDIPQNRRSMQKLADLEPDVACFGHGPVLRDAATKLRVLP